MVHPMMATAQRLALQPAVIEMAEFMISNDLDYAPNFASIPTVLPDLGLFAYADGGWIVAYDTENCCDMHKAVKLVRVST